jgi:hypothetical protein
VPIFALRGFVGLFVLVALLLMPFALYRLIRARQWLIALGLVAALVACPVLMQLAKQIPNERLGLWVAYAVALTAPLSPLAAIMSFSFLVGGVPKGSLRAERTTRELSSEQMQRRRRIRSQGVVALIVSAVAWTVGAFTDTLTKGQGLFCLLLWGYGLVLGLYWTATGSRLNDPNRDAVIGGRKQ